MEKIHFSSPQFYGKTMKKGGYKMRWGRLFIIALAVLATACGGGYQVNSYAISQSDEAIHTQEIATDEEVL